MEISQGSPEDLSELQIAKRQLVESREEVERFRLQSKTLHAKIERLEEKNEDVKFRLVRFFNTLPLNSAITQRESVRIRNVLEQRLQAIIDDQTGQGPRKNKNEKPVDHGGNSNLEILKLKEALAVRESEVFQAPFFP